MLRPRRRILAALAAGAGVTLASVLVGKWFAHLGIPTASTILNDLLVGAGAALIVFLLMDISAERHQQELAAQALKQETLLEERSRMAREIHDTLAQGLSGIVVQLEAARAFPPGSPQAGECGERALSLARESLLEARAALCNLRPDAIQDGDLPHAIEGLAQRLVRGTPIELHFSHRGSASRLPSEVEIGILRVAGEAVTNAVRHSHAHNLYIELSLDGSQVQLWVQDDGRGFAAQESRRDGGFGLTSMRERVEALGGVCRVQSERGQGAQVQARVPVSAARR